MNVTESMAEKSGHKTTLEKDVMFPTTGTSDILSDLSFIDDSHAMDDVWNGINNFNDLFDLDSIDTDNNHPSSDTRSRNTTYQNDNSLASFLDFGINDDTTTAPYTSQMWTGDKNSESLGITNDIFDSINPSHLVSTKTEKDDLEDEYMEPMDVVAGGTGVINDSKGQTSPTYSNSSESSIDSGMSSDYGGNRSMDVEGGLHLPASPPDSPPLLSCGSSGYYSSSSHSPSSNSSLSPSSHSPSSSPNQSAPTSPATASATSNELPTSYIVSGVPPRQITIGNGQSTNSSQFYITKPYIDSSKSKVVGVNKLSTMAPITVVSSNSLPVIRHNPSNIISTSKLNSIGFSKAGSKRALTPVTTTNAIKKSSTSTVLTLSSVNKTNNISKSPSVGVTPRIKNGSAVAVVPATSASIFKTVSSTGKLINTGGQSAIFNSKIFRPSGSNNGVYFISDPDSKNSNGTIQTLKLLPATSAASICSDSIKSSNRGYNIKSGIKTFIPGARKIINVSNPSSLRTATILKNVSFKTVRDANTNSGGVTSHLLTLPKEEHDSDDEYELPKSNQPLILTEEERKLAMKEKIKFPSHYPLNKSQERDLKRIRRKIRNKISAQDSRKRKKEYVDKLEDRITKADHEKDGLRKRIAELEDNEKKLKHKLKQMETIFNAQPTKDTQKNQHHPTTFLFMMLVSIALFVYPSVMPPNGKTSQLLASVAKMPPAGNTRSLLEAAATKLSACQDDEETVDDVEGKVTAATSALNDHDYLPAAKRARFDFSFKDDYCMPILDEQYPPPHTKNKETGRPSADVVADSKGGTEKPKTPPPDDGQLKWLKESPDSTPPPEKHLPKYVQEMTHGELMAVVQRLTEKLSNNWTEPEDRKPSLESLSSSLMVELSASAGNKFLREDIELE